MTEYELLDLISSYRSETGEHVMNFIGAMFGYVAAAYFVGAKLSEFQVTSITVLYTIFTPLPTVAGYESAQGIRASYLEYVARYGEPFVESRLIMWGPELVALVLFSSWAISIVFMFQTRKAIANRRLA